MQYWDIIPFPNFDQKKQEIVAKYYHNPTKIHINPRSTHKDLQKLILDYKSEAGITELDATMQLIKQRINLV